ncbi:MAG: 16S rRNA (guanine(527)-N(7))-methyltransferase RsmG [Nitrospirae bacterium]|nr:16S rRNA (guanine(527)-N(7))-methyltransferase RsmG [Nitrospirota bacterium]
MAVKNRIKKSPIKRKPAKAKPKQKKTIPKKPVQKKGRADLRKLIIKGAEDLNLSLFPNQIDQFLLYFEELKKWNEKVNLTGITDDKEIIIKHFLDSLSFLKGFSPIEGIRIIDVGTGAGFPGIPLKIYSPRISLTLIEASQKKCVFLHHICRLLELSDVNIVNDRLENVKDKFDFIRQYNVFLSRAVADVDEMIKHGAPLLADRGIMIFSKGKASEDLKVGKVIKGMVLLQIIPFTLPMSDYSRKLLVFQKI